mmetsp:Transcript_39621/g.66515  ORF Transcript_39621/g.66515 Transcript_39621/m.66515 type:complete len:244 (-) Transcript_39621:299-1030(-)
MVSTNVCKSSSLLSYRGPSGMRASFKDTHLSITMFAKSGTSFEDAVTQSARRTSPSGMSCDGMYGLTSSTGVPSIKSTDEKYKNPPSRSTFSSFTSDKPSGFGRIGDRQANAPIFCVSAFLGGRIRAFTLKFVFSWNTNMTHTCENCSRVSKEPALNSDVMLSNFNLALEEGARCGWLGVKFLAVYVDSNIPMGLYLNLSRLYLSCSNLRFSLSHPSLRFSSLRCSSLRFSVSHFTARAEYFT